jgi:hypothetical protein
MKHLRVCIIVGVVALSGASAPAAFAPTYAQDKLLLTAPETAPSVTDYSVEDIYISVVSPAIKVTFVSNTGDKRAVYRYVPSDTVTAAQVLTAINYINQGRFKTIDNLTLQAWLITKACQQGFKGCTVGGH